MFTFLGLEDLAKWGEVDAVVEHEDLICTFPLYTTLYAQIAKLLDDICN